jgi:hypothetical protein
VLILATLQCHIPPAVAIFIHKRSSERISHANNARSGGICFEEEKGNYSPVARLIAEQYGLKMGG